MSSKKQNGSIEAVVAILMTLFVFFLIYMFVQSVNFRYTATCKELENWSIADQPARCFRKGATQ